jgi:hypothetical protein
MRRKIEGSVRDVLRSVRGRGEKQALALARVGCHEFFELMERTGVISKGWSCDIRLHDDQLTAAMNWRAQQKDYRAYVYTNIKDAMGIMKEAIDAARD